MVMADTGIKACFYGKERDAAQEMGMGHYLHAAVAPDETAAEGMEPPE